MKKIILLLILLVFPLASAQNVFKSQKQIYLAEYYAHQKEDKKALEHYLEAIKINSKNPSNYVYLEDAAIAFKINKIKLPFNLFPYLVILNIKIYLFKCCEDFFS